MTGGAAAKARLATYDLTAPTVFCAAEKVLDVELVVLDPSASTRLLPRRS
jgi:hypothetical protein